MVAERRRAYIALGANLGAPDQQLRYALQCLDERPSLALIACSPLYRSRAMLLPGQGAQADYCNAVAAVDTLLAPLALLDQLQAIETAAGRVRTERWGPRMLDLDLLYVEGCAVVSERLQLPHPGIATRNFVLRPWADIAADLVVPGIGRIGDAAAAIGSEGLQRWATGGD